MRKQIINRLGAAHIRDTLKQFVAGEIDRFQAMDSLRIGKSQLYELKTSFLAAKSAGNQKWVNSRGGERCIILSIARNYTYWQESRGLAGLKR